MRAYTFHIDFEADDDNRAVRIGEIFFHLLSGQEPCRPGGWDVSGTDHGRRDWSLIIPRGWPFHGDSDDVPGCE